ncbi:MAG: hypothetical protein KDA24_21335 [Deltaproteobacteria bacterium]|nr:hypothetical protein [Deltaproteobacteria bacterium]
MAVDESNEAAPPEPQGGPPGLDDPDSDGLPDDPGVGTPCPPEPRGSGDPESMGGCPCCVTVTLLQYSGKRGVRSGLETEIDVFVQGRGKTYGPTVIPVGPTRLNDVVFQGRVGRCGQEVTLFVSITTRRRVKERNADSGDPLVTVTVEETKVVPVACPGQTIFEVSQKRLPRAPNRKPIKEPVTFTFSVEARCDC